jgi:hypothetical protein
VNHIDFERRNRESEKGITDEARREDLQPAGTKLTSEYFKDQVLREIYQISHGNWRLGRLTRLTIHYNYARVQNVRNVSERLKEYGFVQLVHPPSLPDLAPCDFFLFGYLGKRLKQSAYSTPNELEDAIARTIGAIPRETFLDVFASW